MRIRSTIAAVAAGLAACAAALAQDVSPAYWSDLVDACADCRQALSLYPREDTKTEEILDRIVAQNERFRSAAGRVETHAVDPSAPEPVRTAARAFARGVGVLLDSNQLVFQAYESGLTDEADALLQKAVALRSQGWQQVEAAAAASVRALDGIDPPLAARDAAKIAAKIRESFGREIGRESPPPLYQSLKDLHDRLESVPDQPAAA